MTRPDPETAIVTFLNNLPITIRSTVLSRTLMGLGCFSLDGDSQNTIESITAFLDIGLISLRGYRCAMVAGVIETVLAERPFDLSSMWDEVAAKSKDLTTVTAAAQMPMGERHRDKARDDFRKLRQTVLSPEFLDRSQPLAGG